MHYPSISCGTIETMPKSSIVFAAAGSGGHVFAAIATLKAFQSDFPTLSKDLVFVGSTLTMEGEIRQLPMEERICNRLGIPFRKIRMGKVQRTISVNSLKLLARIVVGFWDAWKLLRELKPSVVVAFGGYVSLSLGHRWKTSGCKNCHTRTNQQYRINK
ncbi:MAG: glycosyltransferase [Candidatus Dojkabacteria bacterium]|nr:MAG: glycosyltransferase [Candidatus Dojkabacteria bacterium]